MARQDDINSALSSELRNLIGAQNAAEDMRKDLEATRGSVATGREAIMSKLALLADAGNWTHKEVTKALEFVAASVNDDQSKKSLATFKSEIKRATHEAVRAHFAAIQQVCNTLWEDEDGAFKTAKATKTALPPKPLAEVFARRYHFLQGVLGAMTGEGKDKSASLPTTADAPTIMAWAMARHPSRSAEAVQKRLDKLAEELRDFARTYACPEAAKIAEQVDGLDAAEAMKRQRESLAASDDDVMRESLAAPGEATTNDPAPVAAAPAIDHLAQIDALLDGAPGVRLAA